MRKTGEGQNVQVRKNKIGKMLFGVAVLLFCLGVKMQYVHAMDWIETETESTSQQSVKITWKKKNVSRIVVKRYNGEKQKGKAKKTVELPGTATSYVDEGLKPEKNYNYSITEYVKKNGKERVRFYGVGFSSTKIPMIEWDEYQTLDGYHDVNYIDLKFFASEGIHSDGIDVFRKKVDSEEDYKVIATLDAKAEKYRDNDVEAYARYSYKIKAFVLKNDQKVYGKENDAVTMRAVKAKPEYNTNITIDKENKNMVLEFKSQSGNADTIFSGKYDADPYFILKKKGDTETRDVHVRMTEYSYDNVTWKKFDRKSEQVLSCDGTIYIKLENYAKKDKSNPNTSVEKNINFYADDVTLKGIEDISMCYNDIKSLACFDRKKNVFVAGINGEYYH